jgi:flavin-binding protein dodecin
MHGQTRWFIAAAAAACCCLLGSPAARAGDAAANQAIAKLLDVGWSQTSQARAAADAQAQLLLPLAASEPRARTAVWLVLLQQRRFDDALKHVEDQLADDPNDLLALRAKVWILTLRKNYAGALVAIDDLGAALADQQPKTEKDRPDFDESIGFLGRILGFLGGPVAESLNQEQRKSVERKVLARFEDAEIAVFEDARNGVLARHIELTGESADSRDEAAAFAVAEKEKTLADVQADRAEIEKRAQELEERKEKIQSELKSELSDIASKDQPLVRELTRLNSRANFLNNDLLNYSAQLSRLQQLAATERNQARQRQLLFEADSLALITSRLDSELSALNLQSRALQQQRATLATRQAQTQAAAASQVQRLEREKADLTKRDRRNDGIEKRATRPVSAASGKSRSLSAQASALSTYDTFPLEAAKANLLDSLRQ